MRDRFQDIVARIFGGVLAFLLISFAMQCGLKVWRALDDRPAAQPSEWKERR